MTSLGDPRHHVRIQPTGTGHKVELDGQDLSRSISHIAVEATRSDVAVTMHLGPGHDLDLEFLAAAVTVVPPASEPEERTEIIVEFLDTIDPHELEDSALNGVGLDLPTGQAILAALRQHAGAQNG